MELRGLRVESEADGGRAARELLREAVVELRLVKLELLGQLDLLQVAQLQDQSGQHLHRQSSALADVQHFQTGPQLEGVAQSRLMGFRLVKTKYRMKMDSKSVFKKVCATSVPTWQQLRTSRVSLDFPSKRGE